MYERWRNFRFRVKQTRQKTGPENRPGRASNCIQKRATIRDKRWVVSRVGFGVFLFGFLWVLLYKGRKFARTHLCESPHTSPCVNAITCRKRVRIEIYTAFKDLASCANGVAHSLWYNVINTLYTLAVLLLHVYSRVRGETLNTFSSTTKRRPETRSHALFVYVRRLSNAQLERLERVK